MNKIIKYILPFLLVSTVSSAQYVDIDKYLSMINNGDITELSNIIKSLKDSKPEDLNVLYLDALLTKNGSSAINKYHKILDTRIKFDYRDEILFNVFSYYYSLGIYKKAETYLALLKSEYPDSKFIKMANRNIPDEDLDVAVNEQPVQVDSIPKIEDAGKEEYRYTIQAGAFSSEKNAKDLKQNFLDEGNHSEIHIKDVGGILLNVVTVGKFNTQEEASKYLSYLKNKYKLNGRIIELNSN